MKKLSKILISSLTLATILSATSNSSTYAYNPTSTTNDTVLSEQRDIVGERVTLNPGQSKTISLNNLTAATFKVRAHSTPNSIYVKIYGDGATQYSQVFVDMDTFEKSFNGGNPYATYYLEVTNLANTSVKVDLNIKSY